MSRIPRALGPACAIFALFFTLAALLSGNHVFELGSLPQKVPSAESARTIELVAKLSLDFVKAALASRGAQ